MEKGIFLWSLYSSEQAASWLEYESEQLTHLDYLLEVSDSSI